MVNPNRFYTYAYLREDRTPYYIGKGTRKRIFQKRKRCCRPPKDKSRIIFLKQNLTEQAAGGVEAGALLGAAGGLEAAGLSADATLFGAPVGMALNIAGGVLGLVAAGEDLIGDKEEKDTLADAETKAKAAPIAQQAQVPIASKALGTTGAEVKDNIQSGR